MYITKALAVTALDGTDCIKIVGVKDFEGESVLYSTIKDMIYYQIDEFDISDDELLAYICIRKGLFTHKEWQALINDWVSRVSEIDYEVDPSKKRLNVIETVYHLGGCSGRVTAEGYRMISSTAARELCFSNMNDPCDYIIEVWGELDTLLNDGVIIGEYADELIRMKRQRSK
jgi:hypothetical protein